MEKKLIFAANWKMYLNVEQAVTLGTQSYDQFFTLAQETKHQIVLCPSFTALPTLQKIYKNTRVAFGAQDCSEHSNGAFTGQVSATDLKILGCSYCIVGHSERRAYCAETDAQVASKAQRLIDLGISPIICIGENAEQYKQNKALEILGNQLHEVFSMIKLNSHMLHDLPICIAYEPIWAIGTGHAATATHLETVFAWLEKETQQNIPSVNCKLLYGGSVKAGNVSDLLPITHLDGFLIGGASLDIQEFEKIVNCSE